MYHNYVSVCDSNERVTVFAPGMHANACLLSYLLTL